MIAGDDPAGIAQVRRECEIELIALIDFVDRHQRTLAHFAGHHGVRSRLGKYEAERDGRLSHDDARALRGNNLVQESRLCSLVSSIYAARHSCYPHKKVLASH